MKKLIGMSLVGLLAITTSTADGQFFSKFKHSDDKIIIGDTKYKVKEGPGGPYVKAKNKSSGYKTKDFSDNTYYGYTTVKSKKGKHKAKTMHSTPSTVTKYKKGKKAKTTYSYTNVKTKKGKYKVKPEQYATVKTKGSKHKVKL